MPANDFHPVASVRSLAQTRPDQIALRCGEAALTYLELDRRSSQVANALLRRGVRAGDRVCYIGRNWPEFFEVLFGCAKIGAVLAPLNWRLTPTDIAQLMADADSTVAITDREFSAAAAASATVITISDGYEKWRDHECSDDPGIHSAPSAEFIQFYTSGTTGLPKGVIISIRNLAHLFQAGPHWRLGPESIVSVVMPLFHMGGSAWALVALLSGAQCVLAPAFDASSLVADLADHGVTNVLVAPTMLQMMVDVADVERADYSTVRSIVYGSAPISLPLLRRTQEVFGAELMQVYGLTETCGAVVQLGPTDHYGSRLASVGLPYPWVELQIRDANGSVVSAAGQDGEIWIRSGQCSEGYWRRPIETAALLTDDGWLRTGDVGHVDKDGYLFITDRLKDMIITGGENVYPSEVERVLVEHPDVVEVAVIGVPDRTWGEAVTAVIVPRDNSQITERRLLEWSQSRIAGFRRPKRIHLVHELPHNPSGKVLKTELRQRFSSP